MSSDTKTVAPAHIARFTLATLATLALATCLLAGCSKHDKPNVEAQAQAQAQPSKQTPDEAKSVAPPAAWALPEALCRHTIGVCDGDPVCAAKKARLSPAGIRVYQLFDLDCEKSLQKRQQVLGAKYDACATCLRDAGDPKSVQDCMFAGGACH